MSESAKAAWLYLSTLGPEARWSALVSAIFLIVYLVRKFAPKVWLAFEVHSPFVVADPAPVLAVLHKVFQAIPSVIMGAVIPALLSGGDWKAAGIGALVGMIPPVQHELAKWSPIPYRGELGKSKPKDPKGPPAGGAGTSAEVIPVTFGKPESGPPDAAAMSVWDFLTHQFNQRGLVMWGAACCVACSSVPLTNKRCSFDNPSYALEVARCRREIVETCSLNSDGTPREDCPALLRCESWRKKECE